MDNCFEASQHKDLLSLSKVTTEGHDSYNLADFMHLLFLDSSYIIL